MLPARLKQLLVILCLFAFLLKLLPSPVYALNANTKSSTNSNVPNNLHVNTQVILIEITSALVCQLFGVDLIDPSNPCLSVDPATKKIGYSDSYDENAKPKVGGAMGAVIGMIATSYNVPVHTSDYTRYMASQFGVVKSVYAQGSGFNNLQPLMDLWKKVRDLTYTAFVLLFVLIGFSIMLRVKIDPRTVMSIQNQIPRIVIAILLITMSYAIVGFLIDFMWVTTYTGINLLTNNVACQDAGTDLASLATNNLLSTPFHYVNRILECPFGIGPNMADLAYRVGLTLGDILTSVISSFLGNTQPPSSSCRLISGDLLACFDYLRFEFVSFLIGGVATLAIGIAMLVQLFRLWFELLKAYILIILYTLLGPVYILLGLFPGSTSFGFTNWIRHVLFALSIYPATVFLFVIAAVLASNTDIRNPLTGTNQMFNPPLVVNPAIDNNMGYILALGAILISPQVIAMMRDAFKSPAGKHSQMIFAGLGVGATAAMAPVKGINSALWARDNAGNPKGPLAALQNMAVGNVTRGVAGKWDWSRKLWDKSYGSTLKTFYQQGSKGELELRPEYKHLSETGKGTNGTNGTDGNPPANANVNNPVDPNLPQGGGGGAGAAASIPNDKEMNMPEGEAEKDKLTEALKESTEAQEQLGEQVEQLSGEMKGTQQQVEEHGKQIESHGQQVNDSNAISSSAAGINRSTNIEMPDLSSDSSTVNMSQQGARVEAITNENLEANKNSGQQILLNGQQWQLKEVTSDGRAIINKPKSIREILSELDEMKGTGQVFLSGAASQTSAVPLNNLMSEGKWITDVPPRSPEDPERIREVEEWKQLQQRIVSGEFDANKHNEALIMTETLEREGERLNKEREEYERRNKK